MYYFLFIGIVGIERLIGLVVAHRNAKWAIAHGGKELGLDHYPAMVSLHALLLVSCLVEVWALGRPFIPWLGWPMIAVVVLSSAIRWRCAAALGRHWNPRLIVIPGAPLVRHGPYRWVRHPDYIAVVAEVAALPLIHSAWLTAIAVHVANALVLTERIRAGERRIGLRLSPQGAIGRFVHSRSGRRDERNHPPAAPVPPSVGIVWPVTNADRSEARNRITRAWSSGSPIRPDRNPLRPLRLLLGGQPLRVGHLQRFGDVGANGVDPHTVAAHLNREAAGEMNDGRFESGVDRILRDSRAALRRRRH